MANEYLQIVAVALLSAGAAQSQSAALKFSSVTIQPHPEGSTDYRLPEVRDGRMIARGPLYVLISRAFRVPLPGPYLIQNAPTWLLKENYDVEAVLPPTALPAGISVQELKRRLREMQQGMLADQLQLRVHHEQREMDSYAARVAEGGVKMPIPMSEKDCPEPRPVDPNDAKVICHSFEGGRGSGMHARAATIEDMTKFVQNWTDKPVVDQTGLTALYRVDTSPWLPIELTGRTVRAGVAKQDNVDYADLPTLFAVFERMGLKLVAEKNVVDLIVIDSVERPSAH